MAIGKASDFKVYQEQFQSGLVEQATQASNAFNDASRGAIRLASVSRKGDYSYAAFFKDTAGVVSRRDTTSVAAVTDIAVTQDEAISVKINRKIGPIAQTVDAFRKIALQLQAQQAALMGGAAPAPEAGEQMLDFLLGTQIAKDMQLDMLNAALRAARAALDNQAAVKYTVPSNGTLATSGLVNGLAKFGDATDRVVCWVMHSKPYFDLVASQIAANIFGVSNFNVAQAMPITLNRPVIVTDSASLLVQSGSPLVTDYYTLGLVADGVVVEDTEETSIERFLVTGLEQLVLRLQGEFAYNIGLKGLKWDVSNGGANPTDTAVATGSNWDPCATSFKDYPGIVIKSR